MLNWQGARRHERRMLEVLNLIFRNHPELLAFLFEPGQPRLRQAPEILLVEAGVYSSGEKVLLRVALDLWNGSGHAQLWDLIEGLDLASYRQVLVGLRHLRRTEMDGEHMVWRQPKRACLKSGVAPISPTLMT